MRRHPARSRLVILVCLLACMAWSGEARAAGGPGDPWQSFTPFDGLGTGGVYALFSAQDGVLWAGTETGVSRYDGRWRSFSAAGDAPSGRVRAIAQTTDGALWIGTAAVGLRRCASDDLRCDAPWAAAQGLPADDVRALLADGSDGVWAGTARGVAHLDGQRRLIESGLPEIAVWSLARAADGSLLAGTAGRGVWRRNSAGEWRPLGVSGASTGVDLPAGEVYAVWAAADGRVWAGTDRGLSYHDDGVWHRFGLTDDDDGLSVFALAPHPAGFQTGFRSGRQTVTPTGLWIATDQGVFFSADPVASGRADDWLRMRPAGLLNDYVRALSFDQDGALWLGTLAGLSRYAASAWQTIQDEPLVDQRINAVLADSDGRVWAGTDENGLSVWDGRAWTWYTASNGLPDNRIIALHQDRRGQVWVSTGAGVGHQVAPEGWQFFDGAALGVSLPVYAMAQDATGALLFGAEDGVGGFREDGVAVTVPGLAGKRVNAIQRDRGGGLWFGTARDGLFREANGQLRARAAPRWQAVRQHRGERHHRQPRRRPVGGDLRSGIVASRRSVAGARSIFR